MVFDYDKNSLRLFDYRRFVMLCISFVEVKLLYVVLYAGEVTRFSSYFVGLRILNWRIENIVITVMLVVTLRELVLSAHSDLA